MLRRTLLKTGAAMGGAAALPRVSVAQPARVLKMVPQANLTSLDPVWTTANITRNHGHMIYDTLYGLDAQFRPQPQMAAGHVAEDGGKRVVITLRDGLRFHDGSPVLAKDVVASVKRWMRRNPFGQKLATVTDELSADGDKKVVFRLKRPFPAMFAALAQVSNSPPFVMPERLAMTDAFTQVREAVGSGPFRFKPDEYNSGSLAVYERNADYVPVSSGTPSLTAGPKVVHFDRVEWHIITDAATSAAAIQTGEIDWYEQPPPEIQQLLRRDRNVKIEAIDPLPLTGILRFNHLHAPFNDKKMRQAILPALAQEDFMQAVVGTDPANYQTGVGFFTPGTPLANDAGMGPLTGPRSLDRAKALMREAGYTNQPMRLIGPTDILAPSAMTQVGADLVRRLGFNADIALADWGTVVQRRTSREPLDKGGWSMLFTAFSSFDFATPAAHYPLRGNGTSAWFGWPSIPKLEELRDAWFEAPDLATEQRLAREMQTVAMDELPYVPVGAYKSLTALRSNLVDRVSGLALFWGIRRS
ncbi:ABC transporter substrate-binding protein [Falsiroseomonas selenitidurans]|uniref:ABC transporter substrate-binding protein n=1 Tax=Falsiroseomonas selenitidurans TaxID=2716335 RepID=A0ABX1E7U7_9PROT|nr:ABC transporter substrate-binding protein [Falsiroseomonas selenitidurans]NKC33299.1 ABC transporter substrate-binding protein [Falsiroseomonas selenitidurans]